MCRSSPPSPRCCSRRRPLRHASARPYLLHDTCEAPSSSGSTRVLPDSTGRASQGSPAVLPVLDRFSHPPAPLGVFSLVADAAPERSVGGELGAVGTAKILSPLSLHPGSQLLVVRELLLML